MTDAELAILSLLAEGPSYDHDLNTAIETRGIRRWTAIGYSSMYYVLEKLEKQGLVELVSEEHGHRKFQISPAGVGVLQTAVSDLLSTPHAYDKSFELGLANLHVLKAGQIRTALISRRQDMAIRMNKLHEERKAANGAFQIDALYDHHIRMLEAELAWLDEFTSAWEAQAPAEAETIIEPQIIPRVKQVILPQDPDSVHKQPTRQGAPYARSTPPAMHTLPPTNKPDEEDG
jgi:DNA-binding PadR family transcriptional regulator